VKEYSAKVMGVPPEEECYFSEWDEDKLSEILSTQKAIVKHQKEEKASKIYSIVVVVDDFADDQRVMASRTGSGGSAINTLLTRGRHIFCSCMLSSQKQKAVGSIARINAQALIIFRLRSKAELDAILTEVSNFYPMKTLLEMYELAVNDQPYSFWYINLAASRKEDVFWLRFEQRMIPTDANALEE